MTSQFDLDAHLTSPLRIVGDEAVVSPAPVVVLLSCYMTGSTEGRNLGIAGYSHDFVAKAFAPLLARYGEVRAVVDPRRNLQQEVDRLIAAQRRPVHFSVLPLQDVVLGERVANIAVPAWEFPDAPNEGFDGYPQNDWGATADRCDLVLVSGPFIKAALAGSGTTTAIGIVPVPVDDSYFAVPEWNPEHVDGGRKRRRGARVVAVQNDSAQPCSSRSRMGRGVSPVPSPFQREAQECTATWRSGPRFDVRC